MLAFIAGEYLQNYLYLILIHPSLFEKNLSDKFTGSKFLKGFI